MRLPACAAGALAVYWTTWTLAQQRVLPESAFTFDDAFFVLGVAGAVAVGFAVGRWWILAVGLTPVAVWAGLELAGHVAPYHEAGPPFTRFLESGGWWPVFWLYVAPLALGVIVRKGLAPAPAQPRAEGS